MAITYTDASIFDLDVQALVNPVNCVGISGAGLAKEFARRYPDNDLRYRDACLKHLIVPGRGLITQGNPDGKFIVNFPTKRHWRDASRIEDVVRGLRNLHRELVRREIESVGMPALGAGLGGLHWPSVQHAIEKEFEGSPIEVLVCLPR